MQTQVFDNIKVANQNNICNSLAKMAGVNSERLCWLMLLEVTKVINLSHSDILEIAGNGAASHIALLARQFPTLSFALNGEHNENDASRILWLCDEEIFTNSNFDINNYDAIIICHRPENARKIICDFDGFARIAAKREISDNRALSVFGRGLLRDLFKPRVRGELAA